jgi:DNA-binding NtrC family response regulator
MLRSVLERFARQLGFDVMTFPTAVRHWTDCPRFVRMWRLSISRCPRLAVSFVKEFAKRFEKPIAGLTPAAERVLQQASWPGNVRELRNTLERACMLSAGRMLGECDVVRALDRTRTPQVKPSIASDSVTHATPLFTREALERALEAESGNRAAAARRLGLSRRALYRRLDSLGLR